MNEQHLRNPAGRLWLLFDHMDAGANNQSLVPKLSAYLGVEPAPSVDFFTALAPVMALPGLFSEAVLRLVDPAIPVEDLLDELPKIISTVTIYGALASSGQAAQQHDAGTMKTLAHASHLLNKSLPASPAAITEKLAELRELAEALVALVTDDTSLPFELRRLLLEHMAAFVRSINLYKVCGVEGVLAEIDRLRGDFVRQTETYSAAKASPKVWEGVKNLMTAVVLFGAVVHVPVAIANDVAAVLEITMAPAAPPETVDSPGSDTGLELPPVTSGVAD